MAVCESLTALCENFANALRLIFYTAKHTQSFREG
jgi:hypothetical protein